MTEQELITSMLNLTSDAKVVLQNLATYGTANQDVTFNLSGGITATVPSLPKQQAAFNSTVAAQQLAMATDFAGVIVGMVLTRDSTTGRINSATATLSTGWTISHTYTRGANGKIASAVVVVTNASSVVLATVTRTFNYDSSSRFLSIS